MNKIVNKLNLIETERALTVGIYARPKMGKTALLLQILDILADGKGAICFFSLEESCDNLKVHCEKMGIDIGKFKIIVNPYGSISEIEAAISKIEDIKVIAFDYLQLMECPGDFLNREECHSIVINWIKGLSKRSNVPVIFSSYLNRDTEDNPEGRPLLKDIESVSSKNALPDICASIWRPHDCERGVGTAVAYNIQPHTEIDIFDCNNHLCGRAFTKFNEEQIKFDLDNISLNYAE